MNEFISVKLSEPTVFPDLNKAEGLDADHARDAIQVKRLKFKHIKHMQNGSDENQMLELISVLTGLSENDFDELYTDDAAEITSVVFSFMEKYIVLAQKMAPPRG